MTAVARYIKQADENALFTQGVVSWKLDIQTSQVLKSILADAAWGPVPPHKSNAPHCPSNPVGLLNETQAQAAKQAVALALNDPVLFPNLRKIGALTPKTVELQNGAFDDSWHHDHLSNKRGHAGQFFFIAYMGEHKEWEPSWGGGFHYGQRLLNGDWSQTVQAPLSSQAIYPVHRTALLGWNENPTLIHRAEFLTQKRDRTAFLMPVDLVPHS